MTNSAIQVYFTRKSAQSSMAMQTLRMMSAPPIVGVPAFFRWVCGPSSRTYCPICRRRRRAIIRPPKPMERRSAVSAPKMTREVR